MRVRQTRKRQFGSRSHHARVAASRGLVGDADGLRRSQVSLPAVDEEPNRRRADLHRLPRDPGHVARVSATQPVGADAVVKPEGVEAELKGTHVEGPMRPVVILVGRRLGEEGGRAVAAGLRQHRLRQLAHEVRACLRRLVRYRRLRYRRPLVLVPVANGAEFKRGLVLRATRRPFD